MSVTFSFPAPQCERSRAVSTTRDSKSGEGTWWSSGAWRSCAPTGRIGWTFWTTGRSPEVLRNRGPNGLDGLLCEARWRVDRTLDGDVPTLGRI